MKTAKITAILNNSNPMKDWVQGFKLVTNQGNHRTFKTRHEAQEFAKKYGYKII